MLIIRKKGIFFFILILLGLNSLYGRGIPRQNVVVEIVTDVWCYNCPGAAMGAADLIENQHNVAVLKYHFNDEFTNAYHTHRIDYYGILGYPTAKFDGVLTHSSGSPDSSLYVAYKQYYDKRIDIPSPHTVAIYFENTGDLNWDASIEITEVSDDYDADDLVLHFAVTETDIPHNWFNQTHVKDVLRIMAPDQFGTSLDFSSNDIEVVDLSFTLDEDWKQENMSVIAFVQDKQTKEIFQANIVHLQADFHTVTFDVFDNDGNEIIDAIVTFDVFKNNPGDYSFNNIPGGNYQYKVEKDGYKTIEDEVVVDDEVTLEVVMEELEFFSLGLSAYPEEGGSVYGEGEYYFGEEVTISAEANENYEFVNWSGNTEHIDDPESETATVTMPAGDVEIVANFNDVTYVEKHDAIDMVIFPNPARNKLTVESNELIKQIRLINASGQMVKEISVDASSSEINVSNLKNGAYIMQIFTKESIINEIIQIVN